MFWHLKDPDLAAITAIDHRFGQRWTINYHPPLHAWTGERCSENDHRIHYIVALTGDDLATKIAAAEAETEQPS